MLARYRPLFYGGSGEEAEKFIRMVREQALDGGKLSDNAWITGFASTCLAGDALRWHLSLDPSVQNDWIKFQQALLAQYSRDSPETLTNLVPTPAAAAAPTIDMGAYASTSPRSGRIRVLKDGVPIKYYVDSSYMPGGYIRLTLFESQAMTVKWDRPPGDLQALTIRGETVDFANFPLEMILISAAAILRHFSQK
ncbi:hypothetical protein FRC01_001755 [Tulasnella sp. 417]|nr:hypothetical protein FRC01_001755 [Tulasnella sp. 417]